MKRNVWAIQMKTDRMMGSSVKAGTYPPVPAEIWQQDNKIIKIYLRRNLSWQNLQLIV
jgi:hypothetical protein